MAPTIIGFCSLALRLKGYCATGTFNVGVSHGVQPTMSDGIVKGGRREEKKRRRKENNKKRRGEAARIYKTPTT